MSMEKVKKFVKDHKGGIIAGTLGIAGLALGLGVARFKVHQLYAVNKFKNNENDWFVQLCRDIDEAKKGCNAYTLAEPEELWAAFNKDGNLVDAIRDPDGNIMNPKMLMVFGNKVEK